MNILQFIPSWDVKNYLRKTDYEFNSLEAAWLVNRCPDINLNDKLTYFREITDTLPDMTVNGISDTGITSLHGLLKEYIRITKKLNNEFSASNSKSVYQLKWDITGEHPLPPFAFDTVNGCLEAAKKRYKGFGKTFCFSIYKICGDKYSVQVYDSSYNIKSIFSSNCSDCEIAVLDYLNTVQMHFPTPFRQGNVLKKADKADSRICIFDKFVKHGGRTFASVYLQNRFGCIFKTETDDYLKLEFYRGKFNGERRIIPYLTDAVKGDIDFLTFAQAYHTVLCEENNVPYWEMDNEDF